MKKQPITLPATPPSEDFTNLVNLLALEALEKLSDEELARFGLIRQKADKFSAKPAKVDMGKGVKDEEVAA